MNQEEIKKYLKDNLKINLHYKGDNTLCVELSLDGELITDSFVHYRIKENK